MPKLQMILKAHTKPEKWRPIICCTGTILHNLSQWLDFQFQCLKHWIPSYIKDSQDLIDKLSKLGWLPPNAKHFTADAVSMYTNINIEYAIAMIMAWFHNQKHTKNLPPDFPLNEVIVAMALVMHDNLFEFGDVYKQQISGTAMGTSAVVMWAKIYYIKHESNTLLPKWQPLPLLFYGRFIDDTISLWLQSIDHSHEELNMI